MSVLDYEATCHAFSKYALSSIPTEFERIRRFTKGLVKYLKEATTSFVLTRCTFQSIVDFAPIKSASSMIGRVARRDSISMVNLVHPRHMIEAFRDRAIKAGQFCLSS